MIICVGHAYTTSLVDIGGVEVCAFVLTAELLGRINQLWVTVGSDSQAHTILSRDQSTVEFFTADEDDDGNQIPGGLKLVGDVDLCVSTIGKFWWQGLLRNTDINFRTDKFSMQEAIELPLSLLVEHPGIEDNVVCLPRNECAITAGDILYRWPAIKADKEPYVLG